jgi:hypothetical protein
MGKLLDTVAMSHFSTPDGSLNVSAGGRCFSCPFSRDSLCFVEVELSFALVFGRVVCLQNAFRSDPLPFLELLPNICCSLLSFFS